MKDVDFQVKRVRMKAQACTWVGTLYDTGQTVSVLICLAKGDSVPGEEPDWGTCGAHVAFCPGGVDESHWEIILS